MSETEEFDRIATDIKQILTNQPSHPSALELYGLWKQATEGDVNISRPSLFDFRGKAKYDAWHSKKGMSKDDAKLQYITKGKSVLNEIMSQSLDLFSMAQTVKNVLPQVPIDVIRRDLIVTNNVDETITRLLDATVYYDVETEILPPIKKEEIKTEQTKEEQLRVGDNIASAASNAELKEQISNLESTRIEEENSAISPMSFSTKAATFEKDPQLRMRSYQERKEKLLEIARAHYLYKNSLDK